MVHLFKWKLKLYNFSEILDFINSKENSVHSKRPHALSHPIYRTLCALSPRIHNTQQSCANDKYWQLKNPLEVQKNTHKIEINTRKFGLINFMQLFTLITFFLYFCSSSDITYLVNIFNHICICTTIVFRCKSHHTHTYFVRRNSGKSCTRSMTWIFRQ